MNLKITDLPAYLHIEEKFATGEFNEGSKRKIPIYSYEKGMKGMTPGHYVDAISYGKIRFSEIPQKYLTRDFFINALSSVHKDVLAYVKEHLGTEFDKEFFKDYIATNQYALEFEENCFEYMPLEYIDEEMVSCAMLAAVEKRYIDRRGDFDDWFYSVAKRKPQVLTQDFWTLGARLFAARRNGVNHFLSLTPEQYRTPDYYFVMCLENNTPVMEDFPEKVLPTNFLISLINISVRNIKSFSEKALEQKAPMHNQAEEVKFWQAAMLLDGYIARDIPLNDERVAFFLAHYDKDSPQYSIGFKDSYKRYLKSKEKSACESPKNADVKRAADITLLGALCGLDINTAVDIANADLHAGVNHTELLPIKFRGYVPKEFSKKYDSEEYLCEIYKKLGIEIVDEYDNYYYRVKLPQNLRVEGNYRLLDSDNVLLEYRDVGPFYDRDVYVYEIYCSL